MGATGAVSVPQWKCCRHRELRGHGGTRCPGTSLRTSVLGVGRGIWESQQPANAGPAALGSSTTGTKRRGNELALQTNSPTVETAHRGKFKVMGLWWKFSLRPQTHLFLSITKKCRFISALLSPLATLSPLAGLFLLLPLPVSWARQSESWGMTYFAPCVNTTYH